MERLARFRGQIAPITAISLFGLSMSMSYPLFGLLLERMGASGSAIGLNQTMPALSIVVFAPLMPVLVGRFGLYRLLTASTVLLALSLLAVPLWANIWYWGAVRVVLGFAATALFYGSELWIVGAAPDATRGRIIAAYTVAVSCAFLAGPLFLKVIGVSLILPFAIAATVVLLGLLPIHWGRDTAPEATGGDRPSGRASLGFFRSDPAVVFGVTLFGAIEMGSLGLVSVWAVRSGLTEADAVTLLAFFAAGSVVSPLPIGWAADRYDRVKLMALAGVACLLMPLAMIAVPPTVAPLAAPFFVWGGCAVGFYSLALTEMGARYSGARLSEANASIVLGYGVGAISAPMVYGWAMDLVPPDGVLWALAASAAAYVALSAIRIARTPKALDSAARTSR